MTSCHIKKFAGGQSSTDSDDGSHHTLNEDVPYQPHFNSFRPEHRKRTCTYLSREVQPCLLLFTGETIVIRGHVEKLAWSLASYADILLTKRARMEDIHSSTNMVCNDNNIMTVFY